MKTRELVQAEAVTALIENNGGTVHILTGGGKGKILIDYLKRVGKPFQKVLITVPLLPLIDMWRHEFKKWSTCQDGDTGFIMMRVNGGYINITIETIQSVYKTPDSYDFHCADEIHTQVTEEYSAVFDNIKRQVTIGLTATPDTLRREDKQLLYDKHCPIVYEYLEGESDGVVNKTQFKIVEHTLDNVFQVKAGAKGKQWNVGEKSQFDYLSNQVKKAQILMGNLGSSNYFTDASEWFWNKKGSKEQMESSRKYLNAITGRRRFLLTLTSSSEIAKRLAKQIILENDTNKVLVFSELVEQLKRICKYNVYGEQRPKTLNDDLIQNFNDGSIRALGSVNSLGMGMNLVGVNNAIFESFNSSNTKATQKVGRLHRLGVDDIATLYFINIKDTQVERWLELMLPDQSLGQIDTIQSSVLLK